MPKMYWRAKSLCQNRLRSAAAPDNRAPIFSAMASGGWPGQQEVAVEHCRTRASYVVVDCAGSRVVWYVAGLALSERPPSSWLAARKADRLFSDGTKTSFRL